jgi:DNA-binding response OmpR family regulator
MGSHILIVEDEAPVRELVELFLRKKGFEVTATATRGDAQQLIEHSKFDLAIVDVNLRGDSGLELVGLLERKPTPVPVIVYTGLDVDEYLLKPTVQGDSLRIVSKTDSFNTLLAAVNRCLAKD